MSDEERGGDGRTPSVPPSKAGSGASARPSVPPTDEPQLPTERDRFAVGLLVPTAIAALIANLVGDLLAPGWVGVGSDVVVQRWKWWGTMTPLIATVLGVVTTMSLVMAAVGNTRTSISTRIVATFGAGLVLTLVAVAAAGNVHAPKVLIILFAAAFAVLVSGAVEALAPPLTRGLGILLVLLSFAALLRVGGWGLGWSSGHGGSPSSAGWARVAASAANIGELIAQLFAVLYVVYRPGLRGVISSVVAVAVAFFVATWALGATLDAAGTFRDALQRALTLRIQGSGPSPTWVDPQAMSHEIALLERGARAGVLPLLLPEIASITLAAAALTSAVRRNAPILAAVALAVLSRGQVDAPLRALELTAAALSALVLARGARGGAPSSLPRYP